jgi:hypothetical protein
MPRPRKLTPSYLEHKQTGRGRLVWTDHAGVRHEKLLPGAFGSPDSLSAKAQLELELAASPTRSLDADRRRISVAELLLAYLEHAERYYRGPDGNPTKELDKIKLSIRVMRELHGEVRAWRKAHQWHAYQLRHAYATRVRKHHGLEAAQVLLGHSRADVTQVYAERDEALAATVAAKIG